MWYMDAVGGIELRSSSFETRHRALLSMRSVAGYKSPWSNFASRDAFEIVIPLKTGRFVHTRSRQNVAKSPNHSDR